MGKRSRFSVNAMMFVIALVVMVFDQVTKRMVEADIALGAAVDIPGLSP